jgi:hypothetical protein
VRIEAIRLAEAMLRWGNPKVQQSLHHYFISNNDEAFFNHVRQRFSWAITDLKTIFADNNANKEDGVEDGFDGKPERYDFFPPFFFFENFSRLIFFSVLMILSLFSHQIRMKKHIRIKYLSKIH